MSSELWAAVDDLTKPRQVHLHRDTGVATWTLVPSLWAQLVASVGTGAEQGTGGRSSRYRTPVNLDCLELACTVRDVVVDALAGHDQRPVTTRPTPVVVLVPESLRRLTSVVVTVGDDDLTGWWTYRARSWGRQITSTLRLTEQPQPRRIRDAACPTCGATHVTVMAAAGPERIPALLIDFRGRYVRAAECSACGASWFRGDDLLALADLLATRTPAG